MPQSSEEGKKPNTDQQMLIYCCFNVEELHPVESNFIFQIMMVRKKRKKIQEFKFKKKELM